MCFCKMKIIILIILFLLSEIFLAESYFVYIDDYISFNDAVEDCNNRSLELLTLSTYRQYLDAQDYFSSLNASEYKRTWLALELNTTTDNYYWLNGRILTELKWEYGEPRNSNVTDCGVMNVSSQQWYTTPCTDTRSYLCVGSDESYSVGSTSVDFYTAFLNCQSEGRRLPVAITNLDTKWLNDVINTTAISTDIWLGLIENGDYFKWLSGEDLTPPYRWISNSNRYDRIIYFYTSGSWNWFYSYKYNYIQPYVCQPKSTEPTAVVRSPDKFVFVSNDAVVLSSPRKSTTINSLRRFQCAVECLQDAGCVQFTVQGYLCRTFGENLSITDYSGGHTLWQRKIIS